MKFFTRSRFNFVNNKRLSMLFLLVSLFLLISGKGWTQPIVDFTVSSTTVCSGSSIIFTDNTLNITGSALYNWNFGTGATPATATTVGPHTVTYTGSGIVTVRLDVTDDAGSGFIEKTITVYVIPTIISVTPGSVCGTGIVTLGATSSAGTINWYSASTGGSSLGTGTSFTTPTISITTTYYVDATIGTCTTASRAPVVATVNTIPTITSVTPGSVCGSGTVILGAASSAGTINWYSASTGGSSLGTGTSFTTPTISITTTYYVDATIGTCTTASRAPVVATVNTIPTITSVTPGSVCGSGTVILGAASSAGTINWYSASTGGSSLGTGTSFTTPTISVTTTYYVDATTGTCTTASRTPVVATVNTIPTITSVTPGSVCGSGTVILGAASSAGTINWYSASTGGSSLGTGTSFTTPSLSVTTTYYVDATTGTCTTASRTPVVATVNTIPTITSVTPGSVCGTGTVTLGATSSAGTINWYSASTGGSSLGTGTSFTTPTISVTTTYYVDATIGTCTTASRTPVVATVNTIPTITSVTPGSVCGSGTVILGAASSAGTINWYSASTGGSSLGAGTSFTTPTISITTTYYVDATTGTCTTASRTPVVATVNTIPTITSVTPGSVCGSGTVILGAASSSGTINWYSASTGGSSLGTGTSFTTPSISVTTTYYVDATTGTCTTASRTPVVATVNAIPTITNVTHGSVCGTGTVTLGATSSAGTINWYSASTGGSSLGTGTSFTTPTISVTTSYYVDATLGTCTTGSRTPVVATVNTMPTITGVTPGSVCGSGTVTLGATSSAGTINWYSAATGGTSLGTGTSFTTPSISVTTTYYVDATLGTCTSTPRTSVIATVNPLPVPTLTSSDADNIICAGASVTFTAGGGTNYNFFVGGVSVQNSTINTFTTTSLINGQLYVIVTNSAGCSATSASIHNTVNPLPFIFISAGPTCAPDLQTYSLTVVVSTGTVTSTLGTVTLTGVNTWTIAAIAKGTNVTVTVTDAGGCQNSIAITAPNCDCPVIAPPVSGGNKSYCSGGTIPALTATVLGGETIDWYDSSSGGTLLLSGSLSYTPTAVGTFYAATRNIATTCVSSTRTAIILTMNPLPTPTLTSSDADNIICTGTSVTFTAGGGTSYNFRVGGVSVQTGTSATYTTSTLTTGQVVDVIVTNSNGCTATSGGITTTVNPLPIPTIISSDADNSFCAGTSVTFTGSGGTNYNFRVEGVSVQNGTSATYVTSTLLNTYFVDVIVTDANGCAATSPGISNTVYSVPVPTLTSSDPDNIFCSGTSITFNAGGGTMYNFRVGGASVQDGTESRYITNSLTDGQVLDVIVTIPNGCSATSAGITNSVITSPVADAGSDGDECDLDFTFKAVPSIGAGTWTKTSGPGTPTYNPSPNSPTATVTVSQYGAYTFTWTEVNNTCSSSASVNVNFNQAPKANPGPGGNNCGPDFYFKALPSIGIGTWSKISGPGTATYLTF